MVNTIDQQLGLPDPSQITLKDKPELVFAFGGFALYKSPDGSFKLSDDRGQRVSALSRIPSPSTQQEGSRSFPLRSSVLMAGSSSMSMFIPSGLMVIMGQTGSGKTTLLEKGILPGLLDTQPQYYKFFEELDLPSMDGDAAECLLSAEEFMIRMHLFLDDDNSNVLAIDSLRWFVYSGRGATGSGGTNMSMYADLTRLDQWAHERNKLIIVLINPLAVKDDVYANLADNIRSGVRSSFIFDYSEAGFGTTRSLTHYARGKDLRTSQTLTMSISLDSDDHSAMMGPERGVDVRVVEGEAASINLSSILNSHK
jgi:energy-coupling factor transporter ATP-binding protein EcfA2